MKKILYNITNIPWPIAIGIAIVSSMVGLGVSIFLRWWPGVAMGGALLTIMTLAAVVYLTWWRHNVGKINTSTQIPQRTISGNSQRRQRRGRKSGNR